MDKYLKIKTLYEKCSSFLVSNVYLIVDFEEEGKKEEKDSTIIAIKTKNKLN
jgi:hypothetical protein